MWQDFFCINISHKRESFDVLNFINKVTFSELLYHNLKHYFSHIEAFKCVQVLKKNDICN